MSFCSRCLSWIAVANQKGFSMGDHSIDKL
jgi:hypothetical protein